MAEHVASQCNFCGQVDDHPKSHWNSGETFHFDCLPYDKRKTFIESNPNASSLVDAALSGTHGNELRAFSAKLHAGGKK